MTETNIMSTIIEKNVKIIVLNNKAQQVNKKNQKEN